MPNLPERPFSWIIAWNGATRERYVEIRFPDDRDPIRLPPETVRELVEQTLAKRVLTARDEESDAARSDQPKPNEG